RHLDRLDRRPGGDGAEERYARAARRLRRRRDRERAALVREPLDGALLLEPAEVLVDGRHRREPQMPPDLVQGRRVAVTADVRLDEVEHLLLSPREQPRTL